MAAITSWFDGVQPGRSVCMIDPDNLVSIRVASKLGFTEFERTSYKDVPIVLFERLPAS
jgi:RimJ/RimL family protein N-acetyltransferase